MSVSKSQNYIQVDIEAVEPMTEIDLVNSRFERIASGVGSLKADVSPGIYKVRSRSGRAYQDRLIEIRPEQNLVQVEVEPVEFDTTAPLAGTRHYSPEHEATLRRESLFVHRQVGTGSHLYLVAWDPVEGRGAAAWEGVTIHDEHGTLVAKLGTGYTDAAGDIAAINVEVDPGTYRVRVETGRYGVYEMFVVTSPGWQTQVFGRTVDFEHAEVTTRRFELKSASVFMSRLGEGFTEDAQSARLVEQARQGLVYGRDLVSHSDLRQMLRDKFQDPMLGIYGLHLLLASDRLDHDLIETVYHNIRGLVGPHPDAEVARLRSRTVATQEGRDLSFPRPPMLRSSWNLIAHHSIRRKSMVPLGSLTDLVSDGLLDMQPWLLYRLPTNEATRSASVSVRRAKRVLKGLVELGTTEEGRARLDQAQADPSLSPLQQRIIGASLSQANYVELAAQVDTKQDIAPVSAAQIMRSLEVPTTSVARSTGSLIEKLDLSDSSFE